MKNNSYKILFVSLTISFIIMYSVMFFNMASFDHLYLSLTRVYMTLLMIAPMAVLMLILMKKMFTNKKLNLIMICTSTAIFIIALILLRTQTPISDIQYMKAMIPHHSSAILTSQNADIKDPQVKQLSQEIIEAQEREIELMKELINKLEK